MSDERSRELLSAYLDGALDDCEVEELAVLWAEQPELSTFGQRYQLVGQLVRSERIQENHGPSLAARVRAEVEADGRFDDAACEDPSLVPAAKASQAAEGEAAVIDLNARRGRMRALAKPIAGLALAAGVAAVAVGVLRVWNEADVGAGAPSAAPLAMSAPSASATAVSDTPASSPARPPLHLASAPLRWDVAQPAVEKRLNMYLVNHSEVSRSGTHGMLPYARIVGYEPPNTDRR